MHSRKRPALVTTTFSNSGGGVGGGGGEGLGERRFRIKSVEMEKRL